MRHQGAHGSNTNGNSHGVNYWLDKTWRICRTCDAWDGFARENNGRNMERERVIGRSIWQFIQGDATRMWLDALVSHARLTERMVVRDYRCDSPDLKRYMEMRIEPGAGGMVCLKHRLVKTEPMAPRVAYEAAPKGAQAICFRCSICNRVQVKGRWMEGDVAVEKGLLAEMFNPRVAYGVCPDCREKGRPGFQG